MANIISFKQRKVKSVYEGETASELNGRKTRKIQPTTAGDIIITYNET